MLVICWFYLIEMEANNYGYLHGYIDCRHIMKHENTSGGYPITMKTDKTLFIGF
jgi:hypothetical protein